MTVSDHDVLIALNRDYIDSVQYSDVARFDEILADDFRCSNPDGSILDRQGFLEQTQKPVSISNLQAQEVEVRIFGACAIIHAITSYLDANGDPKQGRYTDVWYKQDNTWLAVSAHVTRG